ncbi:MAG TPA: hypothetical protein ACN46V_09090, partial [Prochlorococcus sp.]
MKELICSSATGWPGIIAFVGIQLLPGGSQLLRPWRLWSIRLLFPNPKAKEATPTAAVAAIAKSGSKFTNTLLDLSMSFSTTNRQSSLCKFMNVSTSLICEGFGNLSAAGTMPTSNHSVENGRLKNVSASFT